MKCPKCKEEYSRTVWEIHVTRCKGLDPVEPVEAVGPTEEEIRARGKELKIPAAHNKNLDKLEAEIAAAEDLLK